jgi:hypothetical protein
MLRRAALGAMGDAMPLSFSSPQIDAVMRAAAPLDRQHRPDFLHFIVDQFPGRSEVGDGELHRVVTIAQRKYLDPPDLSHSFGAAPLRTDKLRCAAASSPSD